MEDVAPIVILVLLLGIILLLGLLWREDREIKKYETYSQAEAIGRARLEYAGLALYEVGLRDNGGWEAAGEQEEQISLAPVAVRKQGNVFFLHFASQRGPWGRR